jgi:hypothetical protein
MPHVGHYLLLCHRVLHVNFGVALFQHSFLFHDLRRASRGSARATVCGHSFTFNANALFVSFSTTYICFQRKMQKPAKSHIELSYLQNLPKRTLSQMLHYLEVCYRKFSTAAAVLTICFACGLVTSCLSQVANAALTNLPEESLA